MTREPEEMFEEIVRRSLEAEAIEPGAVGLADEILELEVHEVKGKLVIGQVVPTADGVRLVVTCECVFGGIVAVGDVGMLPEDVVWADEEGEDEHVRLFFVERRVTLAGEVRQMDAGSASIEVDWLSIRESQAAA